MFWRMFIFRGLSTRKPASVIWNIEQGDRFLFCWPAQELVLPTANTGNLGKYFEKNAGEWTVRVEISSRKKSLKVGEACMAISWPTPGFKERTFEFWVLNRWAFNFCVRITPLPCSHIERIKVNRCPFLKVPKRCKSKVCQVTARHRSHPALHWDSASVGCHG